MCDKRGTRCEPAQTFFVWRRVIVELSPRAPRYFRASRELGEASVTLPVVSTEPVPAQRAPVDPASLRHRDLLSGDFWRRIPAFRDVSAADFLDHNFQAR